MENYKILIYILIGVIYFIFKNRKKKVPGSTPYSSKKETTIPKRYTLINKGKEIQRTASDKEAKVVNILDYDDKIKDEERNWEAPAMKDTDRDNKEKFEPYSENSNNTNEIGRLLKNPVSLKNAMIVNEILTPKHF